jgi:biotin synthase
LETQKPPPLESYRRIQLARYLIVNGEARFVNVQFDVEGRIYDFGVNPTILYEAVESGVAFQTSGCKDCNRPYYNEKPSGPINNYPRKLTKEEIEKIKAELGILG